MTPQPTLSNTAQRALDHINQHASIDAQARLKAAIQTTGADGRLLHSIQHRVAHHGVCIDLCFHPDRRAACGRTVIEALFEEGAYKSQFETGISNGSLTAYRGGARDRWEEKLFGGAYQCPQAHLAQRPRYGALALMGHPDGAAPRFGSCHLRLKPQVSHRATLTYGDSHLGPSAVGTTTVSGQWLAALLLDLHHRGRALGVHANVSEALTRINSNLSKTPPSYTTVGRVMDDYIEAQIHGGVNLRRDGLRLVGDPGFWGTETGRWLEKTAQRYGLEMAWHPGYALQAQQVPARTRGLCISVLARGLDEHDELTAKHIGSTLAAVMDGLARESDADEMERALQRFKRLWHTMVIHGRSPVT